MSVKEEIRKEIKANEDIKFREFNASLIPNIDRSLVIGVKTPILKEIAKKYKDRDDIDEFLYDLPHKYFEENQIHAFIISSYKDFDITIDCINKFLPYVNNWATCDQMKPKAFKKNKDKLIEWVKVWIQSDKVYTIRFAILMLLSFYLDEDYNKDYLYLVNENKCDDYYVKMIKAWYYATALSKQYEDSIKIIEDKVLDKWTHNKTITKAIESYRISGEEKEYLRTLKIK